MNLISIKSLAKSKIKRSLREAYEVCHSVPNNLALQWRKKQFAKKLSNFEAPYKLHLGCGAIKFESWVNIDLHLSSRAADISWDLSQGIPLEDGSCEFLYCEHFLEHMNAEQGVAFLRECYRVLRSDGVIRIAMPSLDVLIEKSYQGNWREQDWLTWPGFEFIQTRAEMLNICFRSWGHQWLYDREELYRRLSEAGFEKIRDVEWRVSDIAELRNRETRKDSFLICEAQK
ncbi:methyltransferase domain-containing protein [Leptolyngbya sp. FACHB-261]|uniref:class I SAM-dependent methyltransferase n=1 Tax=Leptolyngbya sp. FACHB-261 TaxID=2692806 RepID=UPI0016872CE2|nr:methyltransferase domain-containing protein [Leptolyngbya sp. FACHB-261]MBD2104416.1 methyltransferase domain-containing protein [Leptolyngbya sp. FACHB-261]